MSASRAPELKQQGALEAARDPNSSVTPEAAEKKVVDEAKKAGSAAFQFDPDATPEQKAAQIAGTIPADRRRNRKPKAAALASDTQTGPPDYDLPPPSKNGVVAATSPDSRAANGDINADDDYDWEKVGWAPRFGALPGTFTEDDESVQDQQTWLETRLDDKFYGDWYHNAGIIIFACLTSWVIAVLGGGLGWVLLVMATCGTYYRTSMRRIRRNYRDDINRELAKARLETDAETLEWINSFLVKFWPIYAPVLCKSIVTSVDQVLSTSTPAFLDSLRMKTFTLGTKPPRLEHVKTYPKSDDDIVLMDWKFSFTPNDTSDMTARQIKVKQNPKVALEVRVGKGVISKGLDVIVEDMACSGIMRVKVKLQLPFPHIEKVEICFLEKPVIDYVCKPIGGDMLGLDTGFIPGLSGFIMEQVHANLGPMMYAPNVFPIEIAKMLAGAPIHQAIGVLQVTFHGGQGLTLPGGGTPDPYAIVTINGRTELGRTKIVKDDANPRWNETINIIISSLKDSLDIQVFDFNDYRKDRQLGSATFPLEKLEEDEEFESEHLEVMSNGKARGLVQCDIRFFPVLGEQKLEDGTVLPAPESMTGIARFTVEQAKDLDGTKSLIGQLNPYAVLLLNGKEVHISTKLKRTNNPIWPDAHKELLITNRKTAKLGLVIKDDRDIAVDPIIGTYQIKLDDMLECTAKGQEWYNLANVKTGRAKMMLQWRPVALRGALAGSDGYITPIGVMRLHFQNARDLKNLESIGKSDPYCRVMLSGVQKGRTVTFKNNLNPDWDEVIYVPVHTKRERLTVEVMDEEVTHSDRSLGHFDFPVSDYVHENEDGEYDTNDTKKVITQPLSMGQYRTAKGVVNYTCSFFPAIPTVDPDEEEREEKQKQEANGQPNDKVSMDGKPSVDTARPSTDSLLRKSLEASAAASKPRSERSGTISSLKTSSTNASGDFKKKLEAGGKEQDETSSTRSRKSIPKIRLTPDNLMDYESGLLIFKFIDAELSEADCRLQVFVDDMAYPSYSSAKIKSKRHTFNEVGDAMIRELDQSRITLRLMEHIEREGQGSEDKSIARLSGPTLQTLQRSMYTPTQLTLRDNDGRESKITVSLKFLPIRMKLDPSESFNNMGKLRVDVMDAADLPAADRNGFSDPYCKFILNGKEIYRTDKQKKTLHPAWNETFETMVRSRTAAKFVVEVYDWDFGDTADFLGKADINLNVLQPFQRKEVTLGLDGKSGAVRLRMLFTPEFVTRMRQGSSTFQGTFAAPGKIIGAPVKGVGKGAVFVGSTLGGGVTKAGSFIGKPFRRRTKSGKGEDLQAAAEEGEANGGADRPSTSSAALAPAIAVDGPEATNSMNGNSPTVPRTPNATDSAHARTKSWGAQSRSESMMGASPGGQGDQGTASITILSASGYPPSTNLRVVIKMDTAKGTSKEVHKTKSQKGGGGAASFGDSESVRVPCSADTPFRIAVVNDHRLRSDEELGEAMFVVSDQGSGGETAVKVGAGTVNVRSSFVPAEAGSTTDSPKAGLLRSRFKRESRSVTPSSPVPGSSA